MIVFHAQIIKLVMRLLKNANVNLVLQDHKVMWVMLFYFS